MKKNKLAIFGAVMGFLIIIFSGVRWGIIWDDLSQMIFGVGLGVVIMFYSYIYNWMKHVDSKLKKSEERLENISRWWMEKEWQ